MKHSSWSADLSQDLRRLAARVGLSVGERTTDTGAASGKGHRQFAVEPRIELRIRSKWTLRFDASIDRIDGESRVGRWRLSLHHAATELLPIPWVPLRGGVQGVAFVDLDGDGLPGGAEPRVENLVVRTDGRSRTTDRHGTFSWPDLEPGTYFVEIDAGSVPPAYQLPVDLPIEIRLVAGEDEQIWIALRPCGGVSGVVFLDENRNGSREEDERGLSDLRVGIWRDGVVVASTLTDGTGRFELGRVPAGPYELRTDPAWLPTGWERTTDLAGCQFVLDPNEARTLSPYGLAPRRKPLIRTFPMDD
jgi:hypothetical protein